MYIAFTFRGLIVLQKGKLLAAICEIFINKWWSKCILREWWEDACVCALEGCMCDFTYGCGCWYFSVALQSSKAFASFSNGQVYAPLAVPEPVEIADYSLVKASDFFSDLFRPLLFNRNLEEGKTIGLVPLQTKIFNNKDKACWIQMKVKKIFFPLSFYRMQSHVKKWIEIMLWWMMPCLQDSCIVFFQPKHLWDVCFKEFVFFFTPLLHGHAHF